VAKIRIVTDSTADIPADLLEKYQITVVPLNVHIGNKTYRDFFDVYGAALFGMLDPQEVARTSQPSPGLFMQAYQKLEAEGAETIISIHLSSGLSGTYQAAVLTAKQLPQIDIEVIDSGNVSMAIGFLALEAAKMAEQGKTKDEIKERILTLAPKIKTYFTVDDLNTLQKGGRIGKASAFLGILLNIKPLLLIKEKTIHPLEKVRGKAKGIERLAELVQKEAKPNTKLHAVVVESNIPADGETLMKRLLQDHPDAEIMRTPVGSVLLSHTGPGTVGVVFYFE